MPRGPAAQPPARRRARGGRRPGGGRRRPAPSPQNGRRSNIDVDNANSIDKTLKQLNITFDIVTAKIIMTIMIMILIKCHQMAGPAAGRRQAAKARRNAAGARSRETRSPWQRASGKLERGRFRHERLSKRESAAFQSQNLKYQSHGLVQLPNAPQKLEAHEPGRPFRIQKLGNLPHASRAEAGTPGAPGPRPRQRPPAAVASDGGVAGGAAGGADGGADGGAEAPSGRSGAAAGGADGGAGGGAGGGADGGAGGGADGGAAASGARCRSAAHARSVFPRSAALRASRCSRC